MAHSPTFRHPLSEPSGSSGDPTFPRTSDETGARFGEDFSRRVNQLLAQAGGGLTPELSIDLVLHEVVRETCILTRADAAAIALKRGGDIVCRATSGESAPALGSHLTRDSGLSAACVRSLEWQRCDDTEADFRVNVEYCRQLGVRSILVVPIVKDGDLLGAIELFSAQPNAFGNHELVVLQRLGADLVAGLDQLEAPPSAELTSPKLAVEKAEEELAPKTHDESRPLPEASTVRAAREVRGADFWSSALLVAVIALALFLGWMVGRAGRRAATSSPEPGRTTARNADASPTSSPKPDLSRSGNASGGGAGTPSDLVVYKDGRVVFALPPSPTAQAKATPVVPAVKRERASVPSVPVRVPQQIAIGYVVSRVEPDYPQAAREARVQGEVVLGVKVGTDGRVQAVNVVQGDSHLNAAAVQAVNQWRFRPFLHDGQPVEFETEVTVVFRLP